MASTTPVTGAPVEPPRPSADEVATELAAHVEALAGPGAVPRPEQVAAVQAVVADGRRTLLVARTGFGKSAVYFSATRMLRDRGWGPTVVVSPLLALMRDQVSAARRLGLVAETLNSSNLDEWGAIEAAIAEDRVDLLLVSPERLANAGFRERVFRLLLERPMALVCDEAHCISDWGHDFRPDYLRLRRLLQDLPAWTPVLATTATANQRVTDDVAAQLGEGTFVLRTSLDRASLHLSVVELDDDAARLAWLSGAVARLEGSGIVYCLTVEQAERTAEWLTGQGLAVAAYTGTSEPSRREVLEDRLRRNELRALVATSALGMGFDKGDLAFCIHLGLPPTPVAYYQQVGRAGRALDRAEVIALPRPREDAAVWRWFEQVALPPERTCLEVLDQLAADRPTSTVALEARVNLGRSRLGTLLKILEVQGAVVRAGNGWRRSAQPWAYDAEKAERLALLRRDEAEQMAAYPTIEGCRLRYLREALDDDEAVDCGRCDRCRPSRWQAEPDPARREEAARFLRGGDVPVEPRKQWPSGLDEPRGRIAAGRQAGAGRALCRAGDGGWGAVVAELLRTAPAADGADRAAPTTGTLPDGLVDAAAGVLNRWSWASRPTWICPVPSRRNGEVVDALADALGRLGKLPVHRALHRVDDGGWQEDQGNSAHQVANVWGRLAVDAEALPDATLLDGPVLLVDDRAVSRWTLTVAAWLLTGAGAGAVLPFVLETR
jgi:ATP-dependent DNA helicase RecQ